MAGTGDSGSPGQPSMGCGLEPMTAGAATIQVDGMARTYEFSLPTGYDENRPYPLLFGFHGAGVEVPRFRMYFDMTTVVGPDAIVVYPQAQGGSMAWNVQRDLPPFDALLTKFKAEYCVDEKHVFAAARGPRADRGVRRLRSGLCSALLRVRRRAQPAALCPEGHLGLLQDAVARHWPTARS